MGRRSLPIHWLQQTEWDQTSGLSRLFCPTSLGIGSGQGGDRARARLSSLTPRALGRVSVMPSSLQHAIYTLILVRRTQPELDTTLQSTSTQAN